MFFLHELVLNDEGDEEADAHTGSDNEPEVNVVLRSKAKQGINERTEPHADEDASPAEAAVLVVLLGLFFNEQLCGICVCALLDESQAEFCVAVLFLDAGDEHHYNGDNGNREREDYRKNRYQFSSFKHSGYKFSV